MAAGGGEGAAARGGRALYYDVGCSVFSMNASQAAFDGTRPSLPLVHVLVKFELLSLFLHEDAPPSGQAAAAGASALCELTLLAPQVRPRGRDVCMHACARMAHAFDSAHVSSPPRAGAART